MAENKPTEENKPADDGSQRTPKERFEAAKALVRERYAAEQKHKRDALEARTPEGRERKSEALKSLRSRLTSRFDGPEDPAKLENQERKREELVETFRKNKQTPGTADDQASETPASERPARLRRMFSVYDRDSRRAENQEQQRRKEERVRELKEKRRNARDQKPPSP